MIVLYVFLVLISCLVLYYLKNGAIYLPTSSGRIDQIIHFANIKNGTKVVDLGSGDGRIVIAMAKAGAIATGFEINPILVWWARFKIWRAGLSDNAKIYSKNFWNQDLGDYQVIVVFGMTHIMARLEKKIQKELSKESIVISYIFKFPNLPLSFSEQGVHVYKML